MLKTNILDNLTRQRAALKVLSELLNEEFERLRYRDRLFEKAEELGHFGYTEWDYENGRSRSCTAEYARIFGMTVAEAQARLDIEDMELPVPGTADP